MGAASGTVRLYVCVEASVSVCVCVDRIGGGVTLASKRGCYLISTDSRQDEMSSDCIGSHQSFRKTTGAPK